MLVDRAFVNRSAVTISLGRGEDVLAGLREVHADDDALAQAAAQVFDALYAVPTTLPSSQAPLTSAAT